MRIGNSRVMGGVGSRCEELPEYGEADLRARIAELEQTIQAREDMLAIAAHELRNPMHALLLQVSVALSLSRRQGSAPLTEHLERIKHIVDRYVKRATILLDVSRINARKYPLQVEALDLADIARDVTQSYSHEASFHRSSILTQAPAALEGHWDRLAIEQILSNLIANAIKFGAGAPVSLTIETPTDDAVHLTIRDAGNGIAAEDQERIFGRFEQAAQAPGRVGSGIGLWLVRNLVEMHGGTIAVNSAPGAGAEFVVKLPRDATPYQQK